MTTSDTMKQTKTHTSTPRKPFLKTFGQMWKSKTAKIYVKENQSVDVTN